MASITLRANVKPTGGYVETKYWRTGASNDCADHIYANNWNYNVYRSRIVFYIPLSNFKDQTVTSGSLKLVMLSPFSSAAKTKPIAIKILAGGGDNNSSYDSATLFSTITSYGNSKEYSISLTKEAIAIINNAILAQANGSSTTNYISIYLGQGGSSADFGARFVGYNPDSRYSASKPTLSLTYVPSISTGTITTSTPRIGSAINLTIKRNLDTYTHKVEWVINGKVHQTDNNITTSTSFTPLIGSTNDYLGSSTATSTTSAKCIITTYSDAKVEMGRSEVPFTLYMASAPSINWAAAPSISSTHTASDGKYISGYSSVKINAGAVSFNDGSELTGYRFRMNGCGINIDITQTKPEYTTSSLSTQTDANFSVYVSIKDSRGRYSGEKELTGFCYTYTSPVLINNNIYRTAAQNSATVDEMGAYLIVKGNYSYTSIEGWNSIQSVVVTDVSSSPTLTFSSFSSNGYNFSFSSNNKVKAESSYSIKITITDKLSSTPVTISIPEGRYLIHIPRGGKGIGIGTTGQDGCLRLGWPIKDLSIMSKNGNVLYDFSDVISQEGFMQKLGGPFLPTAGGSITGNLYLTENSSAIMDANTSSVLLSYNRSSATGASTGTCVGYHKNITTIRGAEILKHCAGVDSDGKPIMYDIASIGKNIFYSTANTDGTPSSIPGGTAVEGMIWLKPIT